MGVPSNVAGTDPIAVTATGDLPLLGRATEMSELRRAFAEARSGRGGLVMVTGDPGIGKTRLGRELSIEAAGDGAQVAWARGWEGGGAPAYWPWLQVVRALAALRTDEELIADLGAGARRVAQVAPELRERLGLAEAADGGDSEQARFALFDAVWVFLGNAAARAPILILIDDLHTADLPSLLLLAFLARSSAGAAVLLVTTHHDAGPARGPEVDGVVGELSRFGRRLALTGLDADDLRRLIAHRSGAEPSDALVSELAGATDGNPFFSDEVVRLLVAQGRVESSLDPAVGLPLPDSVRDAVRRRVMPISPAAREALELAAVAGRGFRVATLERASGLDRGELLERFDEALGLHLLAEAPSEAGGFRFAHGLIRETLYNDLPSGRRARLHGAIGEALEHARPGPGGAGLVELAYHFTEAAPAGYEDRALHYAQRAGHEALRALAYEHAVELFDGALRALDLSSTRDERRRAELLLARGQAQMYAGGDAGRATLLAAVELTETLGDDGLYAQAALSLGGFGLSPGVVDEVLVGVLERALARIGPGDGAVRARLMVRLAVALYWCDAAPRREALVAEAVAIVRRMDDPATHAAVLDEGRLATSGPDTLERELDWAHELFAMAQRTGDPEVAVRARTWHIDLLLERDDLPAADMAIATLERIATEVRDPRARSYVPLHRARRALMDGHAEECQRLIDAGTKAAWSLQDSTVPLIAGAQLFTLRRAQGRLDELAEAVRQFADTLPAMPVWRCALGIVHLDAGREDDARRELEHLAARGFATLPRDNVWMVSMALLAELCEGLEAAAHADGLHELLAPFATRNVVSPTGVFAGPVARYLGLVAAARGDWDAADEHMQAARAAAQRLSLGPMLALLALDEARILTRRDAPGDADRARALLAEAGERSHTLGIPVIDGRIARVLERLGSPARSSAPAAAPSTAALAREGDVWRVTFDGRVLFVKDAKGLRHLAVLLASPGVELHAVDLVTSGEGRPAAVARGTRAAARDSGLESATIGTGDAGALLDDQAKRAYRERLTDLRAELEEAQSFNDPERVVRAREEMEAIASELSAAVGLGGRDRRASSSAERARVNVTRAVRGAIRKLASADAALGLELEATVHTGYFCRYEPDPRRPVTWDVGGG